MRDKFGPTLNWLRRCWTKVDVQAVEDVFGIKYQRPELPDLIKGVDEVRAWNIAQAREWIGEQRSRL